MSYLGKILFCLLLFYNQRKYSDTQINCNIKPLTGNMNNIDYLVTIVQLSVLEGEIGKYKDLSDFGNSQTVISISNIWVRTPTQQVFPVHSD